MKTDQSVYIGIDAGSTTVKTVVLSSTRSILYSRYERHRADIRKTIITVVSDALDTIEKNVGADTHVMVYASGSGGLSISKWLNVPFVQEVTAAAAAVRAFIPQTDVAIELGGEDAKITYFGTAIEQRMNGTCAGGTGAFIDQMAALLETDAAGLNTFAKEARTIYPIAARCGVFAKTDVQPLINEGARKEDIAASIFQAVVTQTISGLACGKPIRGACAFLGGPLHFLDQLRSRFITTLRLAPDEIIVPEHAELFVALGAALYAAADAEKKRQSCCSPLLPHRLDTSALHITHSARLGIETLRTRLHTLTHSELQEVQRLPPLFTSEEQLTAFRTRHAKEQVKKAPLEQACGPLFLGLDAGSTTTKAVIINREGKILWEFYQSNAGNPVQLAVTLLKNLYRSIPAGAYIARSVSTGYGEQLFQAAFGVDAGEVETIAHHRAASFFLPEVDFLLDIGGQDMKCIRIKHGCIASIMLNEACSSGCGSFLDSFAQSLGMPVQTFSQQALYAEKPIDLGSRCTVFMNSKVKQAQKEGASVGDISAGLSYSIIKNALFKVIKLRNAESVGTHIVVQGGTFYNDAVLRAFELITGKEAVRPNISGLMGAYGAALIALDQWQGMGSCEEASPSLVSYTELESFSATVSLQRCGKCPNNCLLTVNRFLRKAATARFITGNRCERGTELPSDTADDSKQKAETSPHPSAQQLPNLFAWKYKRLFAYTPRPPHAAQRGTIGIPRVLNIYENYPLWFTLFTKLHFSVKLSPRTSRSLYEQGLESIPSESVCYPAKLTHGHVEALIKAGVSAIFYPCIPYEKKEDPQAANHFNCPIVTSYPEVLKNNMDSLKAHTGIKYLYPFLPIYNRKRLCDRLYEELNRYWSIPYREIKDAVQAAFTEWEKVKDEIRKKGEEVLREIAEKQLQGVVLAGRPYHIDPEINHGIPELLNGLGLAVLTEDSVAHLGKLPRPLRAVDQWVYHNRLYRAAEYTVHNTALALIQLTSFGCGLDAVTADQVQEIIEASGGMFTLLKIDEGTNLGAVRIRVRSLIAAMKARSHETALFQQRYTGYKRTVFTRAMSKRYTILGPQMAPIQFELLQTAFRCSGFNLEILQETSAADIDCGLKYVNNDACYPAIIVAGQMIAALQSGRYDIHATALIITQTGGGCRATNYIGFIRKALQDAGFGQVPVIGLSAQMFEKNPGFRPTLRLGDKVLKAFCLGDLLMRVLYRTRPYAKEAGAADALYRHYAERIKKELPYMSRRAYHRLIREIVRSFDTLPLTGGSKPRIGVVGEILVKFHPAANNRIVETIEHEQAECVMPDLMDFFFYSVYNGIYKNTALESNLFQRLKYHAMISFMESYRKEIKKQLAQSRRFIPPESIYTLADSTKDILQLGNATGEGWFLTAEMIELIKSGVSCIACIQPFACLPNHVTGKGVIKELRRHYPEAQIAAIDFDPGASEVNQLNRLKLLLANASNGIHPDHTKT